MKNVIVFLFLSFQIFAQTTGKISGKITDASTGEPIIGANVIVEGTNLGAAADIDGYYVILNIKPGLYNLKVSSIGYQATKVLKVRVNIDQTTEVDFKLSEEIYETGEVVVVAKTPIVQKDVASSGVNLNAEEIQNLPVVNVTSVVGLQAGVIGGNIRGSSSGDEIIYQVNGVTMKDSRNNTPYSNVSFTSVEQVKVQTGGFTADVGDVRSGVVQIVTKEGDVNNYSFSFYSQLRNPGNKHYGPSVNDPNSYYLRPYLDDDVAWTGTNNGAWSDYIKRQYPEFDGWNAFAQSTLENNDPNDDLTPEAAQQLLLWQSRKTFDIDKPDYDIDMSFGGPVPLVSKSLGNLRFLASYKQNRTMLLIPLSTEDYRDYDIGLKLTSDVSKGMKLFIEGHYGKQEGTATSTIGAPGIFKGNWSLADRVDFGSYTRDAIFSDAYFSPTTIIRNSLAAKFTHVISPSTYYDVIFNTFGSDYSTNPGRSRNLTKNKLIGNNYYVDEAPFGHYQGNVDAISPAGMLLGIVYSQARDSSKVRNYNLKFDFNSQLDQNNQVKAGIDFKILNNDVNYGVRSVLFTQNNIDRKWNTTPIQAAAYIQDKLEFEGMVATVGLRAEYSDPNTKWYDYSPYDPAFSAANSENRDKLLKKVDLPAQLSFLPRLGVSFPIGLSSKIFLNYGHYQTLPTPSNLYLIIYDFNGKLDYISNPEAELEKTIAYELGYEQSLMEQFFIRATGYYKDISNESRDIKYINSDNGTVSYKKVEPVQYRDIRGFELEINKNRGNWITGFLNYNYMVSSRGKFGWGRYYESKTAQDEYIRESGESWYKQDKWQPRPIARLNIDVFTPNEFGPKLGGIFPFEGLRLNILSTWRAGASQTWYGGGPLIVKNRNNLQWLDYYNTNLRLSKVFYFDNFDIQLFVQINNLFNTKRLSKTGFKNYFDERDYYESLHLSENTTGIEDFAYINIPGDDKPGDYRDFDVEFVPIQGVRNIYDISSPKNNLIYYDAATKNYYEFNNSNWKMVDKSKIDKILDDKAYIDMPNLSFFSFLNPRDVYLGIKLNINL